CQKMGVGTAPKKAAVVSNAFMGLLAEDSPDPPGAKITRVTPDGPADLAGLRVDDVVTKMGDKDIKTFEEMQEVANVAKPNDKVLVQVKRGDKTEVLEMVYAERPAGKGGFGGGGGFGGPGGATATRPYHANYGGPGPDVPGQGQGNFGDGGGYQTPHGGESREPNHNGHPRAQVISHSRGHTT